MSTEIILSGCNSGFKNCRYRINIEKKDGQLITGFYAGIAGLSEFVTGPGFLSDAHRREGKMQPNHDMV